MTHQFLTKALVMSAISLGLIHSGHASSLTASDKLMRSILYPKSGAHCQVRQDSGADILGSSPMLVLKVDGMRVFKKMYHFGGSTPSKSDIYEARNSDETFKELVKTAASFDGCALDAGISVDEARAITSETPAQRLDDKLLFSMLQRKKDAHCSIVEGSSSDLFGASPAIVLKVDGNEVYSYTYHIGRSRIPDNAELYQNRNSDDVVQKIMETAKSWDVCWTDIVPAQLQSQSSAEISQAAVAGQVEKKSAETTSNDVSSSDQISGANRAE